jgi:hypothetical protein
VLASRIGSAWQQRRPASLPGHRRRNPILGLVTPIAAHAFFARVGRLLRDAGLRTEDAGGGWRSLQFVPARSASASRSNCAVSAGSLLFHTRPAGGSSSNRRSSGPCGAMHYARGRYLPEAAPLTSRYPRYRCPGWRKGPR